MRGLVTIAIASIVLVASLASPIDGSAGPVAVCDGQAATITGAGVINGTSGKDVIVGSAGNDRIRGNGGNDVICGGGGDDTINGNSGNDRIFGENGTDRIAGDAGNDYLDLGSDPVNFGVGESAIGGTGNDYLTGNASSVTCDPTTRRCTGVPVYDGGAGDDTIEASGNLRGGSGNDILTGSGLMEGGSGDDVITGGFSEQHGGSGDDELSGGVGSQILNGGSGSDSCDDTDSDILVSCEQVT
jgi:Ca2+-binding RTX toxin-like protein